LSTVLTLVERVEGATSAELTGATGWQAHTVRAALSGLRQKGHTIESSKRDRLTCYHAATASRSAEAHVRASAGV
jgi:DNA-binding transcriptional regulator PaaX